MRVRTLSLATLAAFGLLAANGCPPQTIQETKLLASDGTARDRFGFSVSVADNVAVIEAYRDWLTRTEIPKLLFHASPGGIIQAEGVAWCREQLSNLDTVDIGEGIHFVQEDNPELIGSELAKWHAAL